jgi:RNA polymerase sigma-70 factor (ECF subfamily)
VLARYRDAARADDFDELVRRYGGPLRRYLARYLGDPVSADDVLQDTFLQVHARRRLYRDGCSARAWLYAITTRRAVDAQRRAGRRAAVSLDQPVGPGEASEPAALVDLLADDDLGPLDALHEGERQQWVRDIVPRLPGLLRQALVLCYYDGLKYAEIAEVLGVPLNTVKSRLHAAIARLRAMARAEDLAGSR